MAELILHHYELSPYAEKVRRVMGFKGLSWLSAMTSLTPPRPELTALTGGNRRIPVLQIGADIFCDSNLILETLEAVAPAPTLYPKGSAALSHAVSRWYEPRMFLNVSPVRFQGPEDFPGMSDAERGAFITDRRPFMTGLLEFSEASGRRLTARQHLMAHAAFLAATLRDNGDFLCGPAPSHADFSAYHPMRMLLLEPVRAEWGDDHHLIAAWVSRLDAFGTGERTEVTAQNALAAAANADPNPAFAEGIGELCGRGVRITPDDYGRDPVEGVVAGETADRITLRRETADAGMAHIHFPKWGYRLDLLA